jgi:hypothetical protein
VSSQSQLPWTIKVIDSSVSLKLPADFDTTLKIMDRITVSRLQLEQATVIFMKIDVIDTVPLPKDSSELKIDYAKMLSGYLKRSNGQLVEDKVMKVGKYIGDFVKAKMVIEGVEYFAEQQNFALNGDSYNIQLIFPVDKEIALADLRNQFLGVFVINSSTKQFSD